MCTCIIIVVQDPVNANVCQDDDATFTCVLFIPSGIAASSPVWFRNGGGYDTTRHTVVDNVTVGARGPAYVSSTITVNNVATLDDDGALYQCSLVTAFSNNGTLNVVGK